jgi:DNA polymerase III delta prime subunit
MTCNYVERIIDPLQSRCQVLKIVPPSKVDVAKHIAWILGEENTEFELDDIKIIVNQFYPDLRKCLNTIQLSTQDNKLIIDKSILVSSNYMNQVLKSLSNAKPNWKEIRQIIANANVKDFEELYRYLFDNSSEFAPGNEGMVAVYINEYSYQANFRIDKEICTMALIAKIIELK